jgi:uncharacterized membrane protein YhaH (DUF805 family)
MLPSKFCIQGAAVDNVTIIRIVAGLIAVFIFIPVAIIPYWMIFKKAGFSPWLALLEIIPFVGLVVLYVVGFSEWKKPVTGRAPQSGFDGQS